MPTYKSGVGFEFKVDVDSLLETPTGTPDLQDLCAVEVAIVINESVDTFYRLCDEGFGTNVVTALDPQFDLTLKFDDDDTTLETIYKKRFDVNRVGDFQIIDNLTGETIDFTGEITAISDARNVDGGVTEISISVKLRGKPTIA